MSYAETNEGCDGGIGTVDGAETGRVEVGFSAAKKAGDAAAALVCFGADPAQFGGAGNSVAGRVYSAGAEHFVLRTLAAPERRQQEMLPTPNLCHKHKPTQSDTLSPSTKAYMTRCEDMLIPVPNKCLYGGDSAGTARILNT